MGLFDKWKSPEEGAEFDNHEEVPEAKPETDAAAAAPKTSRSGSFALTDEVTSERIIEQIKQVGLNYSVTPDDKVVILFRGFVANVIWADKVPMLNVNAAWHPNASMEAMPVLLGTVTELNANRIAPRAFLEAADDGQLSINCDMVTPFELGATDDQLRETILHSLGAIQNLMEELDRRFPDTRFAVTETEEEAGE